MNYFLVNEDEGVKALQNTHLMVQFDQPKPYAYDSILFLILMRFRLFKELRTRLLALGCLDVRREILLERLIKNPKEGKNDEREPVVCL